MTGWPLDQLDPVPVRVADKGRQRADCPRRVVECGAILGEEAGTPDLGGGATRRSCCPQLAPCWKKSRFSLRSIPAQ